MKQQVRIEGSTSVRAAISLVASASRSSLDRQATLMWTTANAEATLCRAWRSQPNGNGVVHTKVISSEESI